MYKLSMLALLVLLAACPNPSTPPQPGDFDANIVDGQVQPDPGTPAQVSACKTAEANLLKLGCKDSEGRLLGGPNKLNQPFNVVCTNAAANRVDMNPGCLAALKSCDGVNACPR